MNDMTLQEAIDTFLQYHQSHDFEQAAGYEACLEAFADYLLRFSDLFLDEDEDPQDLSCWEKDLQDHMENLLDGDVEYVSNLGSLRCSDLEAAHLSEFLGWYMLRMQVPDEELIKGYCNCFRAWFGFMRERQWISLESYAEFMVSLTELEGESTRSAKAAILLFHYVRLGRGIPARLKEHRFSSFREGHARVVGLKGSQIWLRFDGQASPIGPVSLSEEIVSFLMVGDVLDVELGLRGDTWLIVDVGPIYPHSVYVEAEEIELSDKVC